MQVQNISNSTNFRSKIEPTQYMNGLMKNIEKELSTKSQVSTPTKKVILSLESILKDGKNKNIKITGNTIANENSIDIFVDQKVFLRKKAVQPTTTLLAEALEILCGKKESSLMSKIEEKFINLTYTIKKKNLQKEYLSKLEELTNKKSVNNYQTEINELKTLEQKEKKLYKQIEFLQAKDKNSFKQKYESIQQEIFGKE